jgi:ABC-2 type transport system permease protein
MLNLLRADFFKLKKDRTVIVAIIIMFIFSLLNPLTYLILKNMDLTGMPEQFSTMYTEISGRVVFLMGFNIFNNSGLILPIMIVLFLAREFSYGTIRNKLITGKTRIQVYLSDLIVGTVYGIVMVTILSVLSLAFGTLILGYGSAFSIGFILKVYITGLIIFIVSFAISTFLIFVTRSMAFSLIVNLFFLVIVGAIGTTLSGKSDLLDIIMDLTIVGQTLSVMNGQVTTAFMLKTILTSIITIALITFVGIKLFEKADLK